MSYTVSDAVEQKLSALLETRAVQAALESIEKDQENSLEEQIRLTCVEAPTYQEQQRAELFKQLLCELGLEDVHIDRGGNVLGLRRGTKPGKKVLVEAHMDTVFPLGSVQGVRREDGYLFAPGISDDTRGLAVILGVIRALNEANITCCSDILFAGTTREEGGGAMGGMKDLLDGMDLKNTDLDVALNAIIGAMVKNGYFNGEDGKILVTVQNNDAAKASEIRTLVVSDIDAALKANSAGASILNQTVSADSQAETFAKEQGISIGKAVFVLNLAALGGDLDPAALSKMSLTELAELVKEKKLDIGKIIDYDADDSLFENIAEGIEDAQLVGIKAELEVAEAKAAALIAAGISGDKASFIKAELERDDGRLYYDIKFRADNVVYEFEINAVTGVIEDREEDREKAVASSSSSAITVEQAKKAALDHAGADSTARVIHAELDKEDGRLVYEVEFVFANAEYEYEIDAATGEIVSYDMEGVRLPAGSGADPEGSRITAEQAEDIALAHAGVARADAVLGLTELDKDDGRTVYEVSFRVDRLE